MILALPMYYLIYSMIKKKTEKIIGSVSLTPYALELKIRMLCNGINELDEVSIEAVRELFKEATEKFLEFELLYVWECNFEKMVLDSPIIAMKKLLKVLFIKNRPTFIKKSVLKYDECSSIESKYFFYVMLKESKGTIIGKDFALLKYLKNLSYINNLDEESCIKLVGFIDANLSSGVNTALNIANKAVEFNKVLGNNEARLQENLKSDEPENTSKSIYDNFKDKLFNGTTLTEDPHKVKRRQSYLDVLLGNNKEQVNPTIVVSGHPEAIGMIIYANTEVKKLLGADGTSKLVGINFIRLIPSPFDVMHKEILSKVLLFGNLTELRRSHIVILDLNGFSIEVAMHVRLAFYSYTPYFVLEFIPRLPKECLLLCSPQGKIYSFSIELEGIVNKETDNIEKLYPNMLEYFESQEYGKTFMYSEGEKNEVMKIIKLQIDFELLYVVYLVDSEILIKKENVNKNYNKLNSMFHLTKKKTLDSEKVLKRDGHFSMRKKKLKPTVEVMQSLSSPDTIKSNIAILKWIKRICSIALILLILAWTIFETNFGDNAVLVDIMNDMGIIRISTLSIGTFLRSYDLSLQGYSTLYPSEQYKPLISAECLTLQTYLYGLQKYSSVYDISQHLKDTEIVTYDFYNTVPVRETVNIFAGLENLISKTNTFLNSTSGSIDSYLYIYHNSFISLFNNINSTNYLSLKKVNGDSSRIFSEINYLKVLLIAPVLVLLFASIPFFIALEKISKRQWSVLCSTSTQTFMLVRNKTVERLSVIHNMECTEVGELARAKNLQHRLWHKYFAVIGLYFILVAFYMLIMNFVLETSLESLYSLRIDFAFWGGLRRSLSRRSFVFARESYLSYFSNVSITSLIPNYRDFQPIEQIYEDDLTEFKWVDFSLLIQTSRFSYNFDTYIEMMVSNPCNVAVLVANCSTSLISRGITSAIDTYKFNLEFLVNGGFSGWDALKQQELDSNLFVDGLNAANTWYKDNAIFYVGMYIQLIGVLCAVTSVLVVLCTVLLHFQLKSIEVEMLSIYQLGHLLSDRSFTRSNSNTSDLA